ncbi:MAG: hypothetical protein Alpg2KO_07920 [Alphaproteobacteria bacterium]
MRKIHPTKLNKRGATGIEYGLLIGLVSIIGLVAITSVGSNVSGLMGGVSDSLSGAIGAQPQSASAPDPCPGFLVAANTCAFSSDGTFSVPDGVTTIRALLVGGGGGGSTGNGGGGGGGEVIYDPALAVSGSISVTVGSAGTGAPQSGSNGTAGGDSILAGLAAVGGQGGTGLGGNGSSGGGDGETILSSGTAGAGGSAGANGQEAAGGATAGLGANGGSGYTAADLGPVSYASYAAGGAGGDGTASSSGGGGGGAGGVAISLTGIFTPTANDGDQPAFASVTRGRGGTGFGAAGGSGGGNSSTSFGGGDGAAGIVVIQWD